ncbi:MAG: HDOD domain-containing protein [Phycisphaerales bacterium]
MGNVLLIDDSADIRTLIQRVLAKAGHTVTAAASADEGLAALLKQPVDIVLLDLEMPDKDGTTCLASIRATKALARTRVLMVTATPLRDVVQRVLRLGVQGIVIKSGNWAPALVAHVQKVLAAAPPAAPAHAPAPHAPHASHASPAPAAQPHAPSHPLPLGAVPAQVGTAAPPTATHQPAPAAARVVIEPWTLPTFTEGSAPMSVERGMELLKSLKPMIARSDLLETMLADTVSVRAIKPAAQQVLRLLERPGSSVQTIAGAIRQDQALSLRILKIANSSLYSRGDHVDSVAKAVSRIGLDQIRSAVLSVAILDAFGSAPVSGAIRPDWFWEHAAASAILAMRLAQAAGRPKEVCDTLFTAGLLHDLGRVLFAEQLPDHYPKVVEAAERLELPLEMVESRLLLMNHADITDRLLRHWKFPASIIAPVSLHHLSVGSVKATNPRAADDVIALALANRLAHALLMGSSGSEVLYPIDDCVEHLRLDPARVAEICAKTVDDLADLRTNMLMHAGASRQTYVDSVRARLGHTRALVLALNPATEPLSMMFAKLQGETPPEKPNLIILRVCAAGERVGAMSLLGQAAQRLGEATSPAGPLPILVVGNSKACLFAAGVLGNRAVRQATLPLGLNRLLREMGELARPTAEAPRAMAA